MKEISNEELKKIIEGHKKWLKHKWSIYEKRADLRDVSFKGKDLSYVDLTGADLRGASFEGAKLYKTNFSDADLQNADFGFTKLTEVNFYNASMKGVKSLMFVPMVCPETGAFIAWRNVRGKIVKLLVPEDAKRSSGTTRKCRCDNAVILEIQEVYGQNIETVKGNFDDFVYRVGETIKIDNFNEDRWDYGPGIQFFMQREEVMFEETGDIGTPIEDCEIIEISPMD